MDTKELLLRAKDFIKPDYYSFFAKYCEKYEINTALRLAHFLAQVNYESGYMNYIEENLNYSAKRLLQVFPKYFKTVDEANEYAYKPEKIANKVYANRIGNRDEASGDGWKYRGRGLIQLTGKANYVAFDRFLNADGEIISNPDLVAKNKEYAVLTAFFYWDSRKLNNLIDKDGNQYFVCKEITKRINGGYNGINDRWGRFQKYYAKIKD
jgi:putative chitinase